MKSIKLGVWGMIGVGLAMLLLMVFLFSGARVSAQAATDPVLVGAGDIASCTRSGDEATAGLLDSIPGTVATFGDNAYDAGTRAEFDNCYDPSWGRHKARTRPAAGDEDYETANASGYFGYFGGAAGDPEKGYYSYDLGSWHVVVLNSNCAAVGGCGAGSAQERWLRADLEAHPNPCTAAYFHHPRFTSGGVGNTSAVGPFWEALYEAGAEVVLSGHSHTYERFAPQTPGGQADPAQGIRQFVVGTGGKSLNSFKTVRANSEKRISGSYGVLKLTLRPEGYDWQFVTAPGATVADSGSGSCQGGSEPPPPTTDTTPPTVTGTVPTANATVVASTTNVTATFSEDMMTSSITGQTFKLFEKGSTTKIAAAVSYDAATDTATLDPTNSLRRGVTYKAVVSTGAKDLAGNPLDQNSTTTGLQQKAWLFTVG